VTYINRKWNNLIGAYDRVAAYDPVEYYSSALDETFTIYSRTEDSLERNDFATSISSGLMLRAPCGERSSMKESISSSSAAARSV